MDVPVSNVVARKLEFLRDRGFQVCGLVLAMDGSDRRCVVDLHARVQWFGFDANGTMRSCGAASKGYKSSGNVARIRRYSSMVRLPKPGTQARAVLDHVASHGRADTPELANMLRVSKHLTSSVCHSLAARGFLWRFRCGRPGSGADSSAIWTLGDKAKGLRP